MKTSACVFRWAEL